MIPNEIQFSDDGEVPERYQFGESNGTYRAVCSFCGSVEWFSADPDHKKVVKSGRYINGRWHSFDVWEPEPVSDGRAKIEADELEGSRYIPPKPCERCQKDGEVPYHERRGVPGVGTAPAAPIAENGG